MSYKICPKCEQQRPVEEVFCQTPDGDGTCDWDLTLEPVYVPAAALTTQSIGPTCPSGHPVRPGDLVCGECGVFLDELSITPDGIGVPPGAGEEPQAEYGGTTSIAGWEVLSRVNTAGTSAEVFHVRQEGRGEGVLTLWACEVKHDPLVYKALLALAPLPVASVLDVGEWQGRAFEVVATNGAALLAAITETWQPETTRAFVASAAAAIHLTGRAGLRHRDLRPEAFLLSAEDPAAVALCRFGQARLSNRDLDTAVPSELTRYTAPECLAGAVTPAADWWSFGIVLLERLTRDGCFEGINDQAYLMSVVAHGVELPPDIPDEFVVLLRGLLFRDRTKRWQWAEVEAWLRGEPIAPPSEPPLPSTVDV